MGQTDDCSGSTGRGPWSRLRLRLGIQEPPGRPPGAPPRDPRPPQLRSPAQRLPGPPESRWESRLNLPLQPCNRPPTTSSTARPPPPRAIPQPAAHQAARCPATGLPRPRPARSPIAVLQSPTEPPGPPVQIPVLPALSPRRPPPRRPARPPPGAGQQPADHQAARQLLGHQADHQLDDVAALLPTFPSFDRLRALSLLQVAI